MAVRARKTKPVSKAHRSIRKRPEVRVYKTHDWVLPMLKFSRPCSVNLAISDSEVALSIDRRDIIWDRKTGEVTSSGTSLV